MKVLFEIVLKYLIGDHKRYRGLEEGHLLGYGLSPSWSQSCCRC